MEVDGGDLGGGSVRGEVAPCFFEEKKKLVPLFFTKFSLFLSPFFLLLSLGFKQNEVRLHPLTNLAPPSALSIFCSYFPYDLNDEFEVFFNIVPFQGKVLSIQGKV